mmetsp:Transcript_12889/g.15983  ORF Transcript_12889/g.15983 Transcript_12889/m.15983 type:complete len:190 (+) Transcript_12889:76-645(+)
MMSKRNSANKIISKRIKKGYMSIGDNELAGYKVFVNNINYKIGTQILYETFANYGEILHAIVIPKGYAFITFKEQSQAIKAIAYPPIIKGRLCHVELARSTDKKIDTDSISSNICAPKDSIVHVNQHKLDMAVITLSRMNHQTIWNQVMNYHKNAINKLITNMSNENTININLHLTRPLNLKLLSLFHK